MYLVSLPATILGLAIIEWLARLSGVEPMATRSVNRYFWITDSNLGFRNKANGRFRYRSIKGKPYITTDGSGFRRGHGWHSEGSGPVIAFVGDSTTFCAEVNDDETIVSEIAKRIAVRWPKIRCLNAAVRGYGTLQCKRMIKELLTHYPDIKIIVYVACGNDALENLNPITHFPAQAPYAVWNREAAKVEEIDPDCDSQKQVCSWPSSIGLASRIMWAAQSRSAVLGSIPTPIRNSLLAPRFYQHPGGMFGPLRDGRDWKMFGNWAAGKGVTQIFLHLISDMHELCQQRNVQFIGSAFVSSNVSSVGLAEQFANAGVPFIDVRRAFILDRYEYLARRINGDPDVHFNAHGTRTFAEAVAPDLTSLLESIL